MNNAHPALSPCLPSSAPTRRAYSVDEARALLGNISRKSIYDLINSGELASIKIAGRRLVPDVSIDALIQANLTQVA